MVSRIGGGPVSHQLGDSMQSAAPADTQVMVEEVQAISEKAQEQSVVEQQQQLPADKAEQMTESMNKFLETVNTQLRFKFHEKLNEYYVTLVDSKTDQVVREIPSKKLMDIHAAMREFVGLLVDRKI